MGFISDVKDIGEFLNKIGNIELYNKLIEIQKKTLEVMDSNTELKEENKRLKGELRISRVLEYRANAYWSKEDATGEKGPYCSKCFDDGKKVVHMHKKLDLYGRSIYHCPLCKNEIFA